MKKKYGIARSGTAAKGFLSTSRVQTQPETSTIL